jgi:uncharacterized membrane protein
MKSQFEQDKLDRMRNDSNNYKWGIFYYNQKDPRSLVSRRKGIGLSPNFANPNFYIILLGIIILAILLGNI